MNIRGVIFDLDGTLLDSIEDIADTMNRVLGTFDAKGHEVGAYKKFVGHGVAELVRQAFPEAADDEYILEKACQMMKMEYQRSWKNKTRPYDGIEELLEVLTNESLALGVLSNKPEDFAKVMVEHFFDPAIFSQIRGARKNIPLKPDPLCARAMAEKWGFPTNQILFVGDSSTDMLTATRAGMIPVGVLWGYHDEEEILEHGAKVLVDKPIELMDFVI